MSETTIEQMAAERDRLKVAYHELQSDCGVLLGQNQRLREALDFYSDGWGYQRVNELEDELGKWKTEAHEKESERRRLHKALDKYGEHLKDCVWVPCTCGLVEALNEADTK